MTAITPRPRRKPGIAYSAEGLTDLTGYGAVAVGGARLIYAGESRLAGTPDAETAAALQETTTGRRCRAAAACGRERLGTEG